MEYDFVLEPKDLFYHYYDRYFFLISFRDSFYIFLGKPFFKKYNLIFNQDSKQLAIYTFYEENRSNKELTKIMVPTILIIIFAILVGVFILILFRYKIKRKKLNEIEENFDYSPNPNKETRLTSIN